MLYALKWQRLDFLILTYRKFFEVSLVKSSAQPWPIFSFRYDLLEDHELIHATRFSLKDKNEPLD